MKLLWLFLCLSMVACASTKKYEKVLNSWVGADADKLVSAWGAPSNVYAMNDKKKILTFMVSGGSSTSFWQGYATSSNKYCKTEFTINELNAVESWRHEGNMCKIRKVN